MHDALFSAEARRGVSIFKTNYGSIHRGYALCGKRRKRKERNTRDSSTLVQVNDGLLCRRRPSRSCTAAGLAATQRNDRFGSVGRGLFSDSTRLSFLNLSMPCHVHHHIDIAIAIASPVPAPAIVTPSQGQASPVRTGPARQDKTSRSQYVQAQAKASLNSQV